MLLELIREVGIEPKKTSSTKGGEFHSSCPACCGEDRFMVWPNANRYWCRKCNASGDAIQFCRDFLGLKFQEAKDKVGLYSHLRDPSFKQAQIPPVCFPSRSWGQKAQEFIENSYKCLLADLEAMALIKAKYGLLPAIINTYRVGWNPNKVFERRSKWGLDEEPKKLSLCIPKGFVIPTFYQREVNKIKIRDLDWVNGDNFGKYRELPGSGNLISVFGCQSNQFAVVVESELDAMLLVQEIGEFCTCIALGGVSKKPDQKTFEWLKGRKRILYSLDSDEAGRKQYDFWRSNFSNLRAWPSESRKSPADSFVLDKINLRDWFEEGILYWSGN